MSTKCQLQMHVATQILLYGQILGQISRQALPYRSMACALLELALRFDPVVECLLASNRLVPGKHVDETGWRIDGQNGYTWIFATPELTSSAAAKRVPHASSAGY